MNFGAGTIIANYDGANKHRTVIDDDAHIGSNCRPGRAGRGRRRRHRRRRLDLTNDVPAGELTVARARQSSYADWKRPTKKR